jgi:hypothetical protein
MSECLIPKKVVLTDKGINVFVHTDTKSVLKVLNNELDDLVISGRFQSSPNSTLEFLGNI